MLIVQKIRAILFNFINVCEKVPYSTRKTLIDLHCARHKNKQECRVDIKWHQNRQGL